MTSYLIRRIIRLSVAFLTVITIACIDVIPTFALASMREIDRDITIQETKTNAAASTLCRTGVIKLPLTTVFGFFKGPKSYNNETYIYNMTTWVDGGGFDEARYAADYPDVAASVGTSHAALWKHFKSQGFLQGKRAHYKLVYLNDPTLSASSNPVGAPEYEKVEALWAAEDAVNATMTDREKIIAVNNWMCANYSYAFTEPRHRFFQFGQGACDEYTRAFMDIMNVLGIPCIYVSNCNHAWNEVYCDGRWYVIDVSTNDIQGNTRLLVDSHPLEK